MPTLDCAAFPPLLPLAILDPSLPLYEPPSVLPLALLPPSGPNLSPIFPKYPVSLVRGAGVAVGSTCTTLRIGNTLSVAPGLRPPKSEPPGDDIEPRFCFCRNWAALPSLASTGGLIGDTRLVCGDADVLPVDSGAGGGTARPVGVASLSSLPLEVAAAAAGLAAGLSPIVLILRSKTSRALLPDS